MPCQMIRIKEPLISMNSPRTRTVPLPHTTGKKTIRPDMSIQNRRWNMPIKLSSGRKRLIRNPLSQRVTDES